MKRGFAVVILILITTLSQAYRFDVIDNIQWCEQAVNGSVLFQTCEQLRGDWCWCCWLGAPCPWPGVICPCSGGTKDDFCTCCNIVNPFGCRQKLDLLNVSPCPNKLEVYKFENGQLKTEEVTPYYRSSDGSFCLYELRGLKGAFILDKTYYPYYEEVKISNYSKDERRLEKDPWRYAWTLELDKETCRVIGGDLPNESLEGVWDKYLFQHPEDNFGLLNAHLCTSESGNVSVHGILWQQISSKDENRLKFWLFSHEEYFTTEWRECVENDTIWGKIVHYPQYGKFVENFFENENLYKNLEDFFRHRREFLENFSFPMVEATATGFEGSPERGATNLLYYWKVPATRDERSFKEMAYNLFSTLLFNSGVEEVDDLYVEDVVEWNRYMSLPIDQMPSEEYKRPKPDQAFRHKWVKIFAATPSIHDFRNEKRWTKPGDLYLFIGAGFWRNDRCWLSCDARKDYNLHEGCSPLRGRSCECGCGFCGGQVCIIDHILANEQDCSADSRNYEDISEYGRIWCCKGRCGKGKGEPCEDCGATCPGKPGDCFQLCRKEAVMIGLWDAPGAEGWRTLIFWRDSASRSTLGECRRPEINESRLGVREEIQRVCKGCVKVELSVPLPQGVQCMNFRVMDRRSNQPVEVVYERKTCHETVLHYTEIVKPQDWERDFTVNYLFVLEVDVDERAPSPLSFTASANFKTEVMANRFFVPCHRETCEFPRCECAGCKVKFRVECPCGGWGFDCKVQRNGDVVVYRPSFTGVRGKTYVNPPLFFRPRGLAREDVVDDNKCVTHHSSTKTMCKDCDCKEWVKVDNETSCVSCECVEWKEDTLEWEHSVWRPLQVKKPYYTYHNLIQEEGCGGISAIENWDCPGRASRSWVECVRYAEVDGCRCGCKAYEVKYSHCEVEDEIGRCTVTLRREAKTSLDLFSEWASDSITLRVAHENPLNDAKVSIAAYVEQYVVDEERNLDVSARLYLNITPDILARLYFWVNKTNQTETGAVEVTDFTTGFDYFPVNFLVRHHKPKKEVSGPPRRERMEVAVPSPEQFPEGMTEEQQRALAAATALAESLKYTRPPKVLDHTNDWGLFGHPYAPPQCRYACPEGVCNCSREDRRKCKCMNLTTEDGRKRVTWVDRRDCVGHWNQCYDDPCLSKRSFFEEFGARLYDPFVRKLGWYAPEGKAQTAGYGFSSRALVLENNDWAAWNVTPPVLDVKVSPHSFVCFTWGVDSKIGELGNTSFEFRVDGNPSEIWNFSEALKDPRNDRRCQNTHWQEAISEMEVRFRDESAFPFGWNWSCVEVGSPSVEVELEPDGGYDGYRVKDYRVRSFPSIQQGVNFSTNTTNGSIRILVDSLNILTTYDFAEIYTVWKKDLDASDYTAHPYLDLAERYSAPGHYNFTLNFLRFSYYNPFANNMTDVMFTAQDFNHSATIELCSYYTSLSYGEKKLEWLWGIFPVEQTVPKPACVTIDLTKSREEPNLKVDLKICEPMLLLYNLSTKRPELGGEVSCEVRLLYCNRTNNSMRCDPAQPLANGRIELAASGVELLGGDLREEEVNGEKKYYLITDQEGFASFSFRVNETTSRISFSFLGNWLAEPPACPAFTGFELRAFSKLSPARFIAELLKLFLILGVALLIVKFIAKKLALP